MDPYNTITQLVIHAETITWNRFSNFLTGNSILVLAWATIYSNKIEELNARLILFAITVVGVLSCPVWAAIGSRGRKYVIAYTDLARKIEESAIWPRKYLDHKIFTRDVQLRESLPWREFGSYFLLIFTPWCFEVLYILLFYVSIHVRV